MSSDSEANCSASLCSVESAGIFKRCYGPEPQAPESCDCYYWYGWTGERCDQISAFLVFERVISIMFIIWSLVIVFLTARTLLANFMLGYNPVKGVDPILYAGFSVILAALGFFVFYLHQLLSLFDPKRFQVFKLETAIIQNKEEIGLQNEILYIVALQVAVTYCGFTFFFLSNALHKTFTKTLRPQSILHSGLRRDWNFIVLLFSLLITIPFTILNIVGPADFSSFGYLFVFVTNTFFFAARSRKFIKVQRDLNFDDLPLSTKYSVETTINIIKLISRLGTLTLVVAVLLVFAHIGTTQIDQTPGEFVFSPLLRDAGIFLVFLSLTLVSWYFNSTTEGIILLEDYAFCNLLSNWDAMNNRIFPDNDRLISTGFENLLTQMGKNDVSQMQI